MGSLLVWDLRTRPHSPGEPTGSAAAASAAWEIAENPDPELAHFEQPIWICPKFSTDLFATSTSTREEEGEENDFQLGGSTLETKNLGGNVHSVEICCVRCSDVVGGDALIFALDLMGVVSFWRVLELSSVANQRLKLAMQGSLSLAENLYVLGNFLGASYLCVHPQQQAMFVTLSTSGLRQAHRQRSDPLGDGPAKLELIRHPEEEQDFSPCNSIPCNAAFSPFFPGLLLVAYAEGDLALFDTSLCVPVMHWAGAVGMRKGGTGTGGAPAGLASVAWSTLRPCVFFVKCGSSLDLWDLSERPTAPVHSVDLTATNGQRISDSGTNERLACAELIVDSSGRPMVGHDGMVTIFALPSVLTVPLQAVPATHNQGCSERPIEDLLMQGHEKAHNFPTLAQHRRAIDIPKHCALECDVLRRILVGAAPLQAWV
jgi:hypothetical protein